jgi:hypothetical protein
VPRPPRAARRLAAAWNGDRVSRAEIAWAVPRGSRRARSQGQFLHALVRDPALGELRSDRRAHVLEVARVLARFASWEDRTTRPTRARVCELADVGVTTWKKCRLWLEDRGYLGTVRKGRQALYRRVLPAVLDNDRNDAAVYVLAIPRPPERQAPPAPPGTPVTRPPTSSRSEPGTDHTREAPRNDGKPAVPPALLEGAVLKNLSDRAAAHFWRPFAAAGWTPRDLLFAIDHRPGGEQHRRDLHDVIYPAGWLRWRLALWLDDAGQPVASRSQRWAAGNAARLAHRERQRAELAAAAATAAPPGSHFDQLRTERGWRRNTRAT